MITKKEIKAEKMSLKFPKLKATNCIVAFLSSALQAFGMYNIHALSGVTEGGVLGATLLFDHWFGLSPAVSSFVLNIACYVLGWRTLGKSFIAYSAIAACGYLRAVPAPVAGYREPSPSGLRGGRIVYRRRRGALRPGGRRHHR